jgi:hypothetical protein
MRDGCGLDHIPVYVGVEMMAPDGVDETIHDIYEHVKEMFWNAWADLLW